MMIIFFLEALYGKLLWYKIKNKYQITDDDYLLIGCKEEELCRTALECLPDFIEKKYADRALVILPVISRNEVNDGRIVFLSMSERKIKAILRFYTLERFFDRVIVLSLKEPFGSYGLLKKKGITLETLVRNYLLV